MFTLHSVRTTIAGVLSCPFATADTDHDMDGPIQIWIEHPDAKLPIRGSEGAAGLDLYAIQDETVTERVTIINTGIGVKIPKGHYGHVCPRSSLALKGVTVLAGVIDADYQGTVKVLFQSSMGDPIKLTKGDRIAQLLIIPVHMGKVQGSTAPVVKTGRNVGGFGSTDNPHNKTVTCRTNN
uniref:Deoxyuridine 5'-triphosphate nucleotidohydrolase n=1 Tax=Erpetoichthys calabaricus TaxID=27687 RepID=A0A8C4S8X5_ERPCA